MTATFLVEINMSGESNFNLVSEEIKELLDTYYDLEVLSVKPWARSETAPISLGGPPPAPPTLPAK